MDITTLYYALKIGKQVYDLRQPKRLVEPMPPPVQPPIEKITEPIEPIESKTTTDNEALTWTLIFIIIIIIWLFT